MIVIKAENKEHKGTPTWLSCSEMFWNPLDFYNYNQQQL